ncbi:translation protein [Dunaliella salina]|uniref:Large ribosomal subunit protein uL3m n=1 Tax=Dunaliella salina TaxID=3046 RepID=A0ABQ7G6E0_DUNSA|nr:translation protein [Dunaliella salina]|eukprot:KAF5830157.1 translation protein [Dunaliella salina]
MSMPLGPSSLMAKGGVSLLAKGGASLLAKGGVSLLAKGGADPSLGLTWRFLASCSLVQGGFLLCSSTPAPAVAQTSFSSPSHLHSPALSFSQQTSPFQWQQTAHYSACSSSRSSGSLPSCSSSPVHVQKAYAHQASCWISSPGSNRGQKVMRRVFPLPPAIQSVLDAKLQQTHSQQGQEMPHIPDPTPQPLTQSSRRVGCIAYKAGMTHEWDEHGVRVPLTVLWVDNCQVIGLKWEEKHGYNALVLGAGHSKQKSLHPGVAGYYIKHELPFKRQVAEFPVSLDARLPLGFEVTSAHYIPGQTVDVVGWTKWKGFQGVMKRWNFKGMPATHGNSLSHRHGGAIGGRTDPGKVWKGKKMPGNMGDERRTVHDCLVYKVDTDRNLIYIRGQVPGPAGRMVLLRDAFNVQHEVRSSWGLPFPTALLPAHADSEQQVSRGVKVYQRADAPDPYRAYSDDSDYFGVKWTKG